MSYILKLKLFLLFLFYLSSTSHAKVDENFINWKSSLTSEQKVSKLFVSGLRGKSLTNDQAQLLKKWPLSGVIYFKRNFQSAKQFKNLNDQVLKLLGDNSFSFADQEGGSVIRIGSQYDSPTALSVGKLGNKKVTNYLGEAYGSLLKDLRITNNLAPVVDVKDKIQSDFISNRSFGSDANLVSNLSVEFSKGLLKTGTIPTLKHFPGLGSIKYDTHKKTPLKVSSLEKLKEKDWLPYQKHADEGLTFFVMSSHTELVVDGKNLGVVTYSKESMNHLRAITNQDQIVITDDLEMKGARIINTSFEEAAYKSFMSGHDLLLVGWPGVKLKRALNFFNNKASTDLAFQKRLDESLHRIYKITQISEELKSKKPLFNAKASLKLSRTLNSNITNYLVKKDFNSQGKRSLANDDPEVSLVFSSDPVFRRSFDKSIKSFSFLKTENKDIYNMCSKINCILHLTGSKSSKKINRLLSNYNDSKFTIINSVDPNLISLNDRKKHKVFDVLTRSYDLGKQVLSMIEQNKETSTTKGTLKNKSSKYQKVVFLPQKN